MFLNAACLCLLPALLAGGAAALLLLEALRLTQVLLPGLEPAGPWTAAAALVAAAAGVACSRAAQPAPVAPGSSGALMAGARWLTAAAAASCLTQPLLGALTNGSPPTGLAHMLATTLPFVPAALCVGAALALLADVRLALGLCCRSAAAGVLSAAAVGAALAAAQWLTLLAGGSRPLDVAALALATAGVACWALSTFPQPAGTRPPAAQLPAAAPAAAPPPSVAAPVPALPPSSRRGRLCVASSLVGGAVAGVLARRLLGAAEQDSGHNLATLAGVTTWICASTALVALCAWLWPEAARAAASVPGTPATGAAARARRVRAVFAPFLIATAAGVLCGGAWFPSSVRIAARGADGTNPVLLWRVGRISASFAPDAERTLLLGLGTGHSLAAILALRQGAVDCVVEDAASISTPELLPFEGGRAEGTMPPQLACDDASRWLAQHPQGYDLIVGNLFAPGRRGATAECSTERFLALRSALRAGGVAVQWLPLQLMPWPAFGSVTRAFLEAFPDARLFVVSLRADVPLVALVGGLERGLPRREDVDALLARAPSAAGPPAAVDVLDLYVADGWTLGTRLRERPAATNEDPLVELTAQRREADRAFLARTNLRLLADLALPLDTTSLQARPVNDKENRQLGAELTARSAALTGLLMARAAWLELRDSEAGGLSAEERESLENELGSALLSAWKAAPGHLDVRDTLAEWSSELVHQERAELAGALLQPALDMCEDGRLLGLFGGVLVRLGHADTALAVLLRARELAPSDRTVLANLGSAQVLLGQDGEARATLTAARAAFAPQPLPPVLEAVLGLLDGDQRAVTAARVLLPQIPAGEPWAAALERLLMRPPPPPPPPTGG